MLRGDAFITENAELQSCFMPALSQLTTWEQRICLSHSSFWFPIVNIDAKSTGRSQFIDRKMLVYQEIFGHRRVPCIVYLPPCQLRLWDIIYAWSRGNTLFSHWVFRKIPVIVTSWYPAWDYNAKTVALWKGEVTVRPLPVPKWPVKSDGIYRATLWLRNPGLSRRLHD